MRRRARQEEHENLERWLISYADFITLLFAFFVVMYAVSSINEGKYRVLSDTLMEAFNSPPKSLEPIQNGEQTSANPTLLELEPIKPTDTPEGPGSQPDTLTQVAQDFEQSVLPHIDDELINIKRTDQWVEVELNTNFLFKSGSAHPEEAALPVLQRLADVLNKYPNLIQVEGFTDNVPINTVAFPSNWELSAARAASVVHVFMNAGVDAGRMAAIGFGEYQPVADNATPEGRNRNRRVVLVVLADADARRALDTQRSRRAQAGAQEPPVEGLPSQPSGEQP